MADAVSVNATARLQFEEKVVRLRQRTDAAAPADRREGPVLQRRAPVHGSKIALSGPTNVASSCGAQPTRPRPGRARPRIQGALVLVRIHAVIVEFSFLAAAGTTPPDNGRS